MAPTDYDIGKQLAYYQRKYDLNPRSRVFAPLADLLRKSGRVQDALPLLERGLTEHPRYVSALVILGRCHLEIGNSRAAREAFRKVLQLDPDNLVVLKMLAEEAARQEKWSEATGLLERIVVLDPSDEPSENKLAQLRTQSSEGQFETFDEGSDQELDIQDIDDQEPDVQDIDDQEPDVQDIDSEAAGADVSEGEITPEEDVAAEPDLTPADEETISAEAVESFDEVSYADIDDRHPRGTEEVISLDEIGEAIAEAAELLEHESKFNVASEEDKEVRGVEEEGGTQEEVEPEAEAQTQVGTELETEPGTEGEAEGLIESEAEKEREEEEQKIGNRVNRESLATKTLADIYLAQGYREKALGVLHQILERQPDRDDIRTKIATLESAVASEDAPEGTPEAVKPFQPRESAVSELETTVPETTEPETTETAAGVSEAIGPEAGEEMATEPAAEAKRTSEPEAEEEVAIEPEVAEPTAGVSEAIEPVAEEEVATEPDAAEPAFGEPAIPTSEDDQEVVDRKKYFENWIQKISHQPDE